MEYNEVFSADDGAWMAEARKLLEKGLRFVVIDLDQRAYRECVALAQEFDYTCLVEEQGEQREFVIADFPHLLPKSSALSIVTMSNANPPLSSQ